MRRNQVFDSFRTHANMKSALSSCPKTQAQINSQVAYTVLCWRHHIVALLSMRGIKEKRASKWLVRCLSATFFLFDLSTNMPRSFQIFSNIENDSDRNQV